MKQLLVNATRHAVTLLCFTVLLLAVIVPMWNNARDTRPDCIKREPGYMDLRACELQGRAPISLNGEWAFYWNVLLDGGHTATEESVGQAPAYIHVPGNWRPFLASSGYERYGFATYRLILRLPSTQPEYALKITNVRTSSRVIVDGRPLGGSGSPGVDERGTVPRNEPYLVYFSASGPETELIVQVANYAYFSGGIAEPVYLGDPASVNQLSSRNKNYDLMAEAGFLFIGLYFFGLSFQRREDRAFLHLSLLCMAVSLYHLTHSEKLLFQFVPSVSYEGFSKIQSFTIGASVLCLVQYVHSVFEEQFSKVVLRIAQCFAGALTLVVVMTDMRGHSVAAMLIVPLSNFVIVYGTILMGRSIRRRVIGSGFMLLGFFAVIEFIVDMGLNLLLSFSMYSIWPVAFPIFVLSQGLFLSMRHAHAYEMIRSMSARLESQNKEKDDFLLKTSHELKTPLNAIINISQSLIDGAGGTLSPPQREDMQLIAGTSRRLAFLIRDILDYERIKASSLRLYWKDVDLAQVVEVVMEVFQFINTKPEVKVINDIAPGQYRLLVDENRLMQVFYNLLDNALKFTHRGRIRLSAETRADDVVISVEDTGPGIPTEMLGNIFEDYVQAEGQGVASDRSGLGLGLSIAKQMVALHGGRIFATSTPGEGSRFTFTLPLHREATALPEPVEAAAGAGTPAAAASEAATGMEASPLSLPLPQTTPHPPEKAYRILVVDDDYASTKALHNLLTLEGYEVQSVGSGEDALDQLDGDRVFDLCIVDVMMPGMSGYELCRKIRAIYSPLDLPVLMATAGAHYQLNEAGFAAGANDFIHKPYDWSDLRGRVGTLVQLKRSIAELLDSEIAMLRAQIKPHFLYNAINTIIWMSKRDIGKTQGLLLALTDFLRGSFDFEGRESLVPFEAELELIQAYLSLEQARFGARLSVQYELSMTEFWLPPLIVQPLVENAVRHGATSRESGGTVTVATRHVAGGVEITISDNGPGMARPWSPEERPSGRRSDVEGTGRGLQNINRRLLRHFGTRLEVGERPGGGTIVTVRVLQRGEPVTVAEQPSGSIYE